MDRKLKITLIMPSIGRKSANEYIKTWQMEPLAIARIAAITPNDVELKFYDDRIEKIDYDYEADLVAMNMETYTAKRAYEIADEFKKREVPIVMGGYHATLLSDEVKEFGYIPVIGEAEAVWNELIDDLKVNKLKKEYKVTNRPELINAFPDRSIYSDKDYLPLTLVETGRGCKFNCNFCSITSFYKKSYSHRPAEEVVKEIKDLKAKTVFLIDDNIAADRDVAIKLFKALIPLKINWISQISINMANDTEILRLMKKSGCVGVLIGFESLNKKNLKQMNKDVNRVYKDYSNAIKKLRNHGIVVYATFVFGYDNDTERTFKDTLKFAIKNKLFFTAFNQLIPFPGTDLYEIMKKENKLLYEKWWLKDDYFFGDISFKPKTMTNKDLENLCFKYKKKFYSTYSILKRSLDFKANLKNKLMFTTFFVYNFLAQKEVKQRQGLPLGTMHTK